MILFYDLYGIWILERGFPLSSPFLLFFFPLLIIIVIIAIIIIFNTHNHNRVIESKQRMTFQKMIFRIMKMLFIILETGRRGEGKRKGRKENKKKKKKKKRKKKRKKMKKKK